MVFAGIAVLWLVFLVPWLVARAEAPLDDGDASAEQLTDSGRILRQAVLDYQPAEADVSTPLTRKAALAELRMVARRAARRRRRVLLALMLTLTLLAAGWAFSVVPWWTMLVPVGLIGVFLGVARFSVVAMHARLDARAQQIRDGWICENTDIMVLADDEESVRLELSVDLATESLSHGSLWEPIPVTAPTYVSAPLVPRTVRTIDLSAPAPAKPVVPTADALDETQGIELDIERPKAVNE